MLERLEEGCQGVAPDGDCLRLGRQLSSQMRTGPRVRPGSGTSEAITEVGPPLQPAFDHLLSRDENLSFVGRGLAHGVQLRVWRSAQRACPAGMPMILDKVLDLVQAGHAEQHADMAVAGP